MGCKAGSQSPNARPMGKLGAGRSTPWLAGPRSTSPREGVGRTPPMGIRIHPPSTLHLNHAIRLSTHGTASPRPVAARNRGSTDEMFPAATAIPIGPLARRPRRGVTLLEVLVVIGILAIIMAILLPLLGKARSASQRV